MTATRAKGKEFDTVILLDINENVVVQTRRDATRHQGRAQALLRRVHQGAGTCRPSLDERRAGQQVRR